MLQLAASFDAKIGLESNGTNFCHMSRASFKLHFLGNGNGVFFDLFAIQMRKLTRLHRFLVAKSIPSQKVENIRVFRARSARKSKKFRARSARKQRKRKLFVVYFSRKPAHLWLYPPFQISSVLNNFDSKLELLIQQVER